MNGLTTGVEGVSCITVTRGVLRGGTGANQSRCGASLSPRLGAVLLLLVAAFARPLPVWADNSGERSPAATSGDLSNGTNAFVCNDGLSATFTASNQQQIYSMYGLSIPPMSTVTGIQVHLRALNDGSAKNRKLRVSLSWNAGVNYTAELQTRNLRSNYRDFFLGGSTYLWGRTAWTPTEVSDTNFRVKVVGRNLGGGTGSGNIQLDCIPVTVFFQIPGAPDLTIAKTANPDPVQPLQNLTYTITYGNTGASTATNVIVTDTVPANTTYVSASPAGQVTGQPSVGGTGTVTWNVGSVPVGGTGAVTLVVKVNSGVLNGTTILNNAYDIKSDQNTTPTVGNPVSTTVQGTIVLSLSKSDFPDPVGAGATLTYVLTTTNHSTTTTSTNILVSEGFDPNVTYPSPYVYTASSDCGSTSFDSANFVWTIPSLGPSLTCTITFNTTVATPLAAGVLLVNLVDLIDDGGNTASASAITTVGSCGGSPDGTPCNDGNACTQTDSCQSGACTGGNPVMCTASDQCHDVGTCNPANGLCSNPAKPNGSACDDGNACTSNDTCGNGSCVSGGPTNCNDNDQCTDDSCNPATGCVNAAVQDGIACGDANVCDGIETCQQGLCAPGTPLNCSDGNSCTSDSCDATHGCIQTPTAGCCSTDADCADTSACTINERCVNHACTSDPLPCDDTNPCTGDSCNPSSGCVNTPVANNTACDDGNVCNGINTCQNGMCQAGTAPNCDDGNTCTTDSCNTQSGCIHQGTPGCCSSDADCADNTPCTINERCASGACVSDPLDCDDQSPCTTDRCDSTSGCVQNPVPDGQGCGDTNLCNGIEKCSSGSCTHAAGLNCDDANSCTTDSCDPSTGCHNVGTPSCCTTDADCADSSACTINERCDNGSCTSDPRNCDDGEVCTSDSCDPASGCVNTHLLDGSNCSDGDTCNGIETCRSGTCASGTQLTCDDSNSCTTDSCDPSTGCHNVGLPGCCSIDADCADSSACTINERCVNGSCTSDPLPCDDGEVCTSDSCNPASGCVNTPVPNGQACGDADVCNGIETCQNGDCQLGTLLACNDGNPCTDDACDSALGCTHTPVANCCFTDGDCVDSDACTVNERCINGSCTSDTRNCNDGNPCSADSCNPASGCVNTDLVDGTSCSDANACDGVELCNAGDCQAGVAPDCDDRNFCTVDTCDNGSGCQHAPVANCCNSNTQCADADLCSVNERCTAQHSCASDPRNCDDGNVCTQDTCTNPLVGCVHTPLGSGTCDDGSLCTSADACSAGSCVGAPVNCSDGNLCNDLETCLPATGQCSNASGLPLLCAPGSTHWSRTCGAEWDINNPNNPYGVDGRKQYCRQGDPTCDFDNSPETCTFHVAMCFRVPDPRLIPSCPLSDVTQFSLKRPTVKKDATSFNAMMTALMALPGAMHGVKSRDVVFTPVISSVTCTSQVAITVPAGFRKSLRGKALTATGVKDADAITLKCVIPSP